jgi:hypothetical protein
LAGSPAKGTGLAEVVATTAAARPTRADLVAIAAAPAFPDEIWGTAAADTAGIVAMLAAVVADRVVATAAGGTSTGDALLVLLADGEAPSPTALCPTLRAPRLGSASGSASGAIEFGKPLVALARRPVPTSRPATASATLAPGTPSVGVDD